MRLFGYDISRAPRPPASLSTPGGTLGGGWFPVVREPTAGAWQQNLAPLTPPQALAYFAVYGCVTLIGTDCGKLHLRLVAENEDGIWIPTTNPAYSPVLRQPNRYQTIVKFVEQWITSKLIAGNAYVLKQRDARGVVSALYVLDPARVTPLIAPDGAVYYGLKRDDLTGVSDGAVPGQAVVVPAREIIHDPMVTLFHPLVGVTPLYACGMAAQQGLTMQTGSEQFFRQGSHPGGVLTAPGEIGEEQATRIKTYWEANFSGANVGRVAVLGRGLKYEAMTVNATDSQLIEQLNWTAANVCTCYHVPPALLDLGDGSVPDLEPLLQKYHAQCIQSLLTNFELSLDQGLELNPPYGTEFDIDDLIWMVTATKVKAAAESIGAGALSPDEARFKYFGLGKVEGGDTPYMQQQNFSLRALAKRDADDPFSKPAPPPPAAPALPPPTAEDDEAEEKTFLETLDKAFAGLSYAA
jgi:HK97 family phage portal protein